ncbi:MAG: formate dehydrogenase accessory protein FdhD [Novosphingobium sp.]|nr:formate dehydrogenase accessory protein FdhD [Novosphingobium sp.]
MTTIEKLSAGHSFDRPPHLVEGQTRTAFLSLQKDAATQVLYRGVAEETPVAIEINGFGYAVLMASPTDLEDLLYGFFCAERLIIAHSEVLSFDIHRLDAGFIIRTNVPASVAERLMDRVRHRTSDSSCGLCGVENLEQAMRDLPRLVARSRAGDDAIFRALQALPEHQPLNRATGAVHAAALCDAAGRICLVREDVGRHNAFDKLIGAMLRDGLDWAGGFALLSSRCSYELVEKAVLSGCPMLVTISAPTSLAIARAREAGLDLRVLARSDSILAPLPSGHAEV